MRRDFLELDTSVADALPRQQISLEDVESIRLVLSGGSVVDWGRANFETRESVDRYLCTLLLDPGDPVDRERLRYVFNEAVSYIEERLHLEIPPELRNPDDVRDVFLLAGQADGFRRKQILACAILKLMHVIHHMEAADLKFKTPISEAQLFDLAEARVLRLAREMRDQGLPVVSFYGSRKSRSSVITKLIAKKENIAATIFDKLRFRIVVEAPGDLVAVLAWLARHVFPFNYVIPGQSHNNLLDPRSLTAWLPLDHPERLQRLRDEPVVHATGKNEFSGSTYRMINYIVDFPVRLPTVLPGTFGFELGRVVFVMVELQLLDEQTARSNEEGENAHHLYKERQYAVVAQRLKRGAYRKRTKEEEE